MSPTSGSSGPWRLRVLNILCFLDLRNLSFISSPFCSWAIRKSPVNAESWMLPLPKSSPALLSSGGFPHHSMCHSSSANPSKFNILPYSDYGNYFLWKSNKLSLRTLPKHSSSGPNKWCQALFSHSFWHAVTPKQTFASPKVTGINCETDLQELDPSPMTSEHPTLLWWLEINLLKIKYGHQAPK